MEEKARGKSTSFLPVSCPLCESGCQMMSFDVKKLMEFRTVYVLW